MLLSYSNTYFSPSLNLIPAATNLFSKSTILSSQEWNINEIIQCLTF